LLPNYKWVPIGYHGRGSSLRVSGQQIVRPTGQIKAAAEGQPPEFGACRRLDIELEVGAFIGTENMLGQPVSITNAEDHLFGLCILNDWSARDIQVGVSPAGPISCKKLCIDDLSLDCHDGGPCAVSCSNPTAC